MPSCQIGCFWQCSPPFTYSYFAICFMLSHWPFKTSSLMPYIWRINIIENWPNQLSLLFHALHDLDQLIKTPTWGCIVLWENNDGNPRLFNCFDKSWWNPFSFLKLYVIFESVDSLLIQGIAKISCETVTSIFTMEAHKDIINPTMVEARRGGRLFICHSCCKASPSMCCAKCNKNFQTSEGWEDFEMKQQRLP